MRVIIMCGIPGSGKSTYIEKNCLRAITASADSYFAANGGFNPAKLGLAHGKCLRDFIETIQDSEFQHSDIVVDNTNTTTEEIAPYVALALAYGLEVEVIVLVGSVEIAHKRNVHGVSLQTCQAMHERIRAMVFPRHWSGVTVKTIPYT